MLVVLFQQQFVYHAQHLVDNQINIKSNNTELIDILLVTLTFTLDNGSAEDSGINSSSLTTSSLSVNHYHDGVNVKWSINTCHQSF